MTTVRPATYDDLPAILAIYNDAVVNTTAIFNWRTSDLADRRAWFDTRTGQGFPILVADAGQGTGQGALGYASFGDWRPHDGYLHTAEHSVYVAAEARGQGIGAALMGAVIEAARGAGKHVLLGGITADNEPSLALHRRFGFVETARMPEVGRKFDRWLDLVFMQKIL